GQENLATLLHRECLLLDAALYLNMTESAATEQEKLCSRLARELQDATFPVFIAMERGMPASFTAGRRTFRFNLSVPEINVRRLLWKRELNGSALGSRMEAELHALAGKFRFTSGQIRDVVSEARNLALLRGNSADSLDPADIYKAARIRC